jgi:hypothetical protein
MDAVVLLDFFYASHVFSEEFSVGYKKKGVSNTKEKKKKRKRN